MLDGLISLPKGVLVGLNLKKHSHDDVPTMAYNAKTAGLLRSRPKIFFLDFFQQLVSFFFLHRGDGNVKVFASNERVRSALILVMAFFP